MNNIRIKVMFCDSNEKDFEQLINKTIEEQMKTGWNLKDIKYSMITTDSMTSFAHSAIIMFEIP